MTTGMTAPSPTSPRSRRRTRSPRLWPALLCIAMLALLLAPAVARASSQTQFTLVGRGWGHGLGMSQWGAEGYAMPKALGGGGWSYSQIIKHYYSGVALGKTTVKSIRVLLNSYVTTVKIGADGPYIVTTPAIPSSTPPLTIDAKTVTSVTLKNGKYRVVAVVDGVPTTRNFTSPVQFAPTDLTNPKLALRMSAPSEFKVKGRYRGTILIRTPSVKGSGGGFSVINNLGLDDYVKGVLPREVSPLWYPEALKAQAVAARAYGAYARLHSGSRLFDVYCDTRSQAYGGYDAEAKTTTAAVKATAGVVPLYGGKVIQAFFFSTSGGRTENNENVWGGSPIAYLRGVDDPYEGKTPAPFHLWPDNPISRTASSVAAELGFFSVANPKGVNGILKTIYVTRRGKSPRVVEALVIGDKGYSVIGGSSLRSALHLRDTWVKFTTMSITPAKKATVAYRRSAVLSGEIYPALAEGAPATLHYRRDGVWRTVAVKTKRVMRSVPAADGVSPPRDILSSSYRYKVSLTKTTEYYFSAGAAQSPHTVISVAPAVTLVASATTVTAGAKITFSGTVKPLLPGRTIWLQTRGGTTWSNAATTHLSADSSFSLDWTALAGVNAVRMRLRAAADNVNSYSNTITISFFAMSLLPAAADKTSIVVGESVTLSGEIHPALAEGVRVTLHCYRDRVWRTLSVKTTRGKNVVPTASSASPPPDNSPSIYTYTVSPPKTTEYYFSSGAAQSPHTVIRVKPAIKLTASATRIKAGAKVTLTGTVTPPLSGSNVMLQTRSGATWTMVASTPIRSTGAFRLVWSAVSGVNALRMRVAAGSGLVAGYSNVIAVFVN